MKTYCKNQPHAGPVETRIGYHDGYAGRVRNDKYTETSEYRRGYELGQADRQEDDLP